MLTLDRETGATMIDQGRDWWILVGVSTNEGAREQDACCLKMIDCEKIWNVVQADAIGHRSTQNDP
jgi:hypothetical protein